MATVLEGNKPAKKKVVAKKAVVKKVTSPTQKPVLALVKESVKESVKPQSKKAVVVKKAVPAKKNLGGRPPLAAPPAAISERLDATAAKIAKVRELEEEANKAMDADVAWAFGKGTSVVLISEALGITRKTVYASLKRSGVEW